MDRADDNVKVSSSAAGGDFGRGGDADGVWMGGGLLRGKRRRLIA